MTHRPSSTWPLLVKLMMVLLAAILAYCIRSLPTTTGLATAVGDSLPRSGVDHDVTAVLMNFRGYDTLLEVTVLLLALIGTRTLATPGSSRSDPGPILRALALLLIPFLILFAGYLLWAGAYEPGGAFQAGTLLAAAGVLGALAGFPWIVALSDTTLRMLVLLGPVVFTAVGIAMILAGGRFLELPPAVAGAMILLVETAVMISVGITLLAAFHSVLGTDLDAAP